MYDGPYSQLPSSFRIGGPRISRTRDLEFAWATFLTRGMEQGAIPEADPRLLTRAILGLYNSVFHWYRPRGGLALPDVAAFYIPRCLAIAGLPLDLADAPLVHQIGALEAGQ